MVTSRKTLATLGALLLAASATGCESASDEPAQDPAAPAVDQQQSSPDHEQTTEAAKSPDPAAAIERQILDEWERAKQEVDEGSDPFWQDGTAETQNRTREPDSPSDAPSESGDR